MASTSELVTSAAEVEIEKPATVAGPTILENSNDDDDDDDWTRSRKQVQYRIASIRTPGGSIVSESDIFFFGGGGSNRGNTVLWSPKCFQVISGLLIVVGVATSWAGATQFSKSALSETATFYAPYFLVWFSTNFMILCYPVHVVCLLLVRRLFLDVNPNYGFAQINRYTAH